MKTPMLIGILMTLACAVGAEDQQTSKDDAFRIRHSHVNARDVVETHPRGNPSTRQSQSVTTIRHLPEPDLTDRVGPKRRNTASKQVEISLLTDASSSKQPRLSRTTASDMGGDYDWDFVLAGEDLVGILRRDRSGRKKKVEVHIYSATSRYKEPRAGSRRHSTWAATTIGTSPWPGRTWWAS